MPIYEYACGRCGGFASFAPLARYDQPASCPGCAAAAPRAGLSAPMLAGMEASRYKAHAVNEKSANAPGRGGHPAACGCCKTRPAAKSSPKSFPGTRPWMIGH